MNYAIIEISGRQFWVEEGKYYNLNRIPIELGQQILINRILLLNYEDKILIGQPYLKDGIVKGRILKHLRDKKKIIYKMRPKKKTRRKQGHRQKLTRILIEDIVVS